MLLQHEMNKRVERAQMAIAWRLPRWLVYWAAIRLIGHASTGRYGNTLVPDLTAMAALERWAAEDRDRARGRAREDR